MAQLYRIVYTDDDYPCSLCGEYDDKSYEVVEPITEYHEFLCEACFFLWEESVKKENK